MLIVKEYLELKYCIKYDTRYLSSGSMAPDVDTGRARAASRGATPYFLQTPLPSLTAGLERARYSFSLQNQAPINLF